MYQENVWPGDTAGNSSLLQCPVCRVWYRGEHTCDSGRALFPPSRLEQCQRCLSFYVGDHVCRYNEPDEPEGDLRFDAVLKEMSILHARKQQDYGLNWDPFANIRASEQWGIPAWVGALVRGTDKIKRLQTFVQKGTLANEGVEDSLIDLAVYAVIALVLYREQSQQLRSQ